MKLRNLSLFNYFHYYLFSIVIGLLSTNKPLFLVLYIPFFIKIKRYKNKLLLIVFTILVLSYVVIHNNKVKKIPTSNEFIVISSKESEYNTQYIIKQKNKKYLMYSNEVLEIGDIINLEYELRNLKPNRLPNSFNTKHYYGSKHIYYELKPINIITKNNQFHINKIRYKAKSLFNNYPPVIKSYIYMFLFGEDNFEQSFDDAKRVLGINHLFALSGLHINLIIGAINFAFKLFKKKPNEFFIIVFLLIYLFFAGLSFSLLRALMMYMLLVIFRSKSITTLDSFSLSFILIIMYSPYAMYHYGFILSFLVTFFIITSKSIKGFKNKLLIHFTAYLSSLILVSNLNGGIYLLSIFTSLMFAFIFPYIIMPLVIIGLIPKVNYLSNFFLDIINKISVNISFLPFIKIPYQSVYAVVIYLAFLVGLLLSNHIRQIIKRSIVLLVFILLTYLSFYKPTLEVLFLDVGQGDSTLIRNPYNKGNILIDAHSGTYNYLKTLGNIKIDYMFITHGDFDHASEALLIAQNMEVKHIYLNEFDNSKIANSLKQYNTKTAYKGDKFTCGYVSIEVLAPLKNYYNDNNNSLVLKINIADKTYLFTGDIEIEAELDLVDYYNNYLKSDVLHIAHHGSNTGTSLKFLQKVNPTKAIISVGQYNRYNHPNIDVIAKLNKLNIDIHLTSTEQTIIEKRYYFPFIKRKTLKYRN